MRKYLESFLDLFFPPEHAVEELETEQEGEQKYSTAFIIVLVLVIVLLVIAGKNMGF